MKIILIKVTAVIIPSFIIFLEMISVILSCSYIYNFDWNSPVMVLSIVFGFFTTILTSIVFGVIIWLQACALQNGQRKE
jgi:hypothetical protein